MKFYYNVVKLDKLSLLKSIRAEDVLKLQSLTVSNSLKIYFYQNLHNTEWFEFLLETNELLKILNSDSADSDNYSLQLAVSEYLKKVVFAYPRELTKFIKKVNTTNNRIIWDFAEIGVLLPAKYTAQLVSQVRKWTKNSDLSHTNFAPAIAKWFNHLVKGKKIDSALMLLNILTTPKVQKPTRKRIREVEKIVGKDRPKAIPILDYYFLQEILTKVISKLIELRPLEVSSILARSLEKTIKIEYSYNKNRSDLSHIWRPAIEDHPQNYDHFELKEVLLVTLRNTLEIVVSGDKESGLGIVKSYLKHNYSIFKRLAIHLLRLNFEEYIDVALKLSSNKKLLRSNVLYHEYYLFLKDNFKKLPKNLQNSILQAILSHDNADPKAKSELQMKQRRYYWWKQLNFFKDFLTNDNKQLFEKLQTEFREEKFRDTPAWHESYSGFKAPLTVEALEDKSNFEIWNYLKSFTPKRRGIESPSREGLAHIFCEVVKRNPERFLKEDFTPLIDIHPVYSYWLINLLGEQLKEDINSSYFKYINNILTICSRLMRLEKIPIRFTDEMGINFVGVKRRIVDVIQSLIKTHQKEFTLDYKDRIWEIIEYLCYYELDPNDTLDNKSDMDPFTLSLNSVRGAAMNTLIDYALWYAFHTKNNYGDEKRPNRFTGEERIKYLLEDKLVKTNDPSLAIHSTFGVFLSNLAYLNYEWVKENLNKIFPPEKENDIYWRTAWAGYINASRFYSDLFNLLKPQFERAIEYHLEGRKLIASGFGRAPEEALSEHLIVACLNNLDSIKRKNSLLKKFIEIPHNPSITHAVQFIANLAKDDERIFFDDPSFNRKSFWSQAKEFWRIRIDIVKKELRKKNRKDEEDEFDREFSRYISWLDDLPEKVTLKELEPLLTETININQRGWQLPNFIVYLSKQSENFPLIAIKLFEKLMHTKAPSYFFNGKEKEIETILANAIKTKKNEAYYYADIISNKFGELGNYYFKDFWMKNLKDKKITIKPGLKKK